MEDYLEYRKSLSRELIAIKDKVRNLIAAANWAEEGRYKEIILMEILRSMLPTNVLVGTGFVIGENNNKSTQIDIIIYKSDYPQIFKKGDFIIVDKEAVIGIIEVKSNLKTECLEEILKKAHQNGEIIGKNKFNGIFAYETNLGFTNNNLHPNTKDKFKKYSGFINNIAFGENYFMKYWEKNMPHDACEKSHISIYEIPELSIGYFISNLIEDVNNYTTGRPMSNTMYNTLYPLICGKESKRKYDIEIENQ